MMPSKQQIQELIDNTDSTWTIQNGMKGRLFTSKTNGNSIFVPAVGFGGNGYMYDVGSYGGLWSGSLGESNHSSTWYLGFYSGGAVLGYDYRYYGYSVRGCS